MPRRSTSSRTIRPFVSLPRHRRRALVMALQGRMLRRAQYTGSTLFDSDHLLIDPDDPDRLHTWVDVVFPGLDRYMLWNAEFITSETAKRDMASSQAYEAIDAKLKAAGEVYESHTTSHLIPRKHPNEQRIYRVEFAPEKGYDCLNGQTYRQARDALEADLMQSLPAPLERFEIDRRYAYGIGLHAVVNVATFDANSIEQTIAHFRTLGERDWAAS